MNICERGQVFQKSGLAALSDLSDPALKDIFRFLEEEQIVFWGKEAEFRSREYKWPRDPLHNWSRVWEYPYVYHHIANFLRSVPPGISPIVADVGSGVTFFPFSVAKLGCRVMCTDRDLGLARDCVPHSPGRVDFGLTRQGRIPLEDSECDAVYCISVLEHVPEFENMVGEIWRVTKPEGLVLITCDLNMRSDMDLQFGLGGYRRLVSVIDEYFVRVRPEQTIHPLDILTTRNSIYPLGGPTLSMARLGWNLVKQKVLKPLLGRKPGPVVYHSPQLALLGLALKKGHGRKGCNPAPPSSPSPWARRSGSGKKSS